MTILLDKHIKDMINEGRIISSKTVDPEQIQPASLDLRLGSVAYRMQSSSIPLENETVNSKINKYSMYRLHLDGTGAVLESGSIYLIPLIEKLKLSEETFCIANAKSSTGRLDVLCRLIADGEPQFDYVPVGYEGPLYVEVAPRSFNIRVREGSKLNQLRFQNGPIAVNFDSKIHVNLESNAAEVVGYKARKNTKVINVDKKNFYNRLDFWEPIYSNNNQNLVLDLDAFYILSSKENITVEPDTAAEMVAYDYKLGEYKSHYAGYLQRAPA